jgi:hypothetical protein
MGVAVPGVSAVPGGTLSLPEVHRYDAVFTAQAPQAMPPLLTTALRGALLLSLKALVCREPSRLSCAGCPHATHCAYPGLVEPRDEHGREQPAPLVMRPEFPVEDVEDVALQPGDQLRVEFGFVGSAGLENVSLVRAALEGVARRGIGLKQGGHRPTLAFDGLSRVLQPRPVMARSWRLRFSTPLRLTSEGEVAATLTAASLWAGVVRRVRLLGGLYGQGAPELPFEVPWELRGAELRSVTIGRYSERQRKRVFWPGLLGRAELEVTGDAALVTQVLTFIQDVQLGKGTQFGFGAVRCEPSAKEAE